VVNLSASGSELFICKKLPNKDMDIKSTTIEIGGKTVTLETGRFAERATAAVTARLGDTMAIATVVMGRVTPLDYFPLSVEYQEKLYAGGKIKGSRWVKRDGRPSDEAILKGRVIDRTIRPLFPKGFMNEVQVVATILSADGENDADMVAMYAASAAVMGSSIPWEGPVSGVRIGLDKASRKLIVNPTFAERENSDLDLTITGSKTATVMLEAGANEVSEAEMLEAFKLAQTENARVAGEIEAWCKTWGKAKVAFVAKLPSEAAVAAVKAEVTTDQIKAWVKAEATLQPLEGMDDAVVTIAEKYPDVVVGDIKEVIHDMIRDEARRQTIHDQLRPDGRDWTQIRPLSSEVGLLPRTHGSAMFKRGSTQTLTITTLGAPSMNQLVENMEGEVEKRYIHHYIMPPYTVGETGRIGFPSRREIGHGNLAERALIPMLPDQEAFPYTIQVVNELMSSNGSTSMASVCGSTLSMMDAGVPLKKPVAGIAMGLMVDGDEYVVLSDIQGMEDHTGDMDFKVAGTREGITAMQMDIKVKGIPMDVLERALTQAKAGRIFILEHMLTTLNQPRETLSQYAPKIEVVHVPVDMIGQVIGPGGKVIKGIIEATGAQVDIEEDGSCYISAIDADAIAKAVGMVTGIIKEVEPGEEYDGIVSRIENFGVFVDILPGKSGMVHVSQLSTEFVRDPHDVVNIGDALHVRVSEIDNMGRINLTTLTPEQEVAVKAARREGNGGGDRGDRGPRRDDRGGRRFDRGFSSRPPRR
jgi:polyribonucleotide nucleotidyltransferase